MEPITAITRRTLRARAGTATLACALFLLNATGGFGEIAEKAPPGWNPPPGKASCQDSVGVKRAQVYVRECMEVSTATHPPCNALNTCEDILSEVKRGCGFLNNQHIQPGSVSRAVPAPAFCKTYDSAVKPASGSKDPVCGNDTFSDEALKAGTFGSATVQGVGRLYFQTQPNPCQPKKEGCAAKAYVLPGDVLTTHNSWAGYVCALYPKSHVSGWVTQGRLGSGPPQTPKP